MKLYDLRMTREIVEMGLVFRAVSTLSGPVNRVPSLFDCAVGVIGLAFFGSFMRQVAARNGGADFAFGDSMR